MALKLPRPIKGALRRYTRAVTELAVSVPFNVSAVEHSINREEYRQSRSELKECIANAIDLETPFPKRGEEQEVIGMLAKEIADIQYRIKETTARTLKPLIRWRPDRTRKTALWIGMITATLKTIATLLLFAGAITKESSGHTLPPSLTVVPRG